MTAPLKIGPRAGVIGSPIAHSRSPIIHEHWLKTLGLAGSYDRILVEPAALSGFIAAMREQGLVGCNATIPHKEAVAALCQRLTPVAKALGAANTLWFEEGALWGDNTDVMGFIASLDEAAPGWSARTSTARLLGAGGAARGVVYGLAERGVRLIEIANRGHDRAEAMAVDLAPLAARFGARIVVIDWAARSGGLGKVELLVNTTSLGMHGQPRLEIDVGGLPDGAVVADAVYVPLQTALLKAARVRGLVGVDGLGMLLHQARPGFERWFGRAPVVTPELRRLVEADIPKE
jgi:shikimate dehydrogenase